MGGLEHGGNPLWSGLPTPFYMQVTAAWTQIPFPSSFASGSVNNPSPANSRGRRRFLYATQPIYISSNAQGTNAYPIPANTQFECTTRSPMWVSTGAAPFTQATISSSSSVIVPTATSSSSLSQVQVPTSGYSSSSSSASPYSSSSYSNVPVPTINSSSSTGIVTTFGFLFAMEETT
jgi:hypothetical protein